MKRRQMIWIWCRKVKAWWAWLSERRYIVYTNSTHQFHCCVAQINIRDVYLVNNLFYGVFERASWTPEHEQFAIATMLKTKQCWGNYHPNWFRRNDLSPIPLPRPSPPSVDCFTLFLCINKILKLCPWVCCLCLPVLVLMMIMTFPRKCHPTFFLGGVDIFRSRFMIHDDDRR